MEKHHPFGGSVLWRRRECVGSYWAEKDLPELKSDLAKMGSRVHYLTKLFIEQFCRDEEVGLSSEMLEDPGLENLTDEEREMADNCFGFFLSRFNAIKEHNPDFSSTSVLLEAKVELHTDPNDFTSPLLTFGTLDAALLVKSEGRAELFDWKFGYKPFQKDAVGWQVMNYGQSLMEGQGLTDSTNWIYNPRLRARYECSFSVGDGARRMIEEVIHECLNADPENLPYKPGDWCEYCKALGLCPASIEMAKELVSVFDVEPLKTEKKTRDAITEKLKEVTPEKLRVLLDMAAIVKPAYEAVHARAKELLAEHPNALPGWQLTTRGGKRKAPFQDSFHATKGLLEEDEYWDCCEVSVAKLERKVMDKFDTKAEGRRAFKSCMDELISQAKVTELRKRG